MPKQSPEERREKHRQYMVRYLKNPSNMKKHIARIKRLKEKRREEARPFLESFRANGCLLCDEKDSCCMNAHHVDPIQKKFEAGLGSVRTRSLKAVLAELAKCVCLCSNCHDKVHAGRLSLSSSNGKTVPP